MGLTIEDVTGKPESDEDIRDALQAISLEMVRNPMLMLKDGSPATMRFIIIRRALMELLMRRAAERNK